ncbi:hypothetical protein BDP81DRAFT_412880 [Colletotrichum phormii]|uniref:Uncharacterized protein n=1 Tax=Colletotrichum phormii TaxID=359342 RepID=A0AAJ0A323_9PEZI|nr:uncharacterized protein BDP81DRAFT_412880 [Colletotrichum phormii]KAK1655550.1 hypothetical protein BDP81DRAFT_412880 [Colletotrichum phormii]
MLVSQSLRAALILILQGLLLTRLDSDRARTGAPGSRGRSELRLWGRAVSVRTFVIWTNATSASISCWVLGIQDPEVKPGVSVWTDVLGTVTVALLLQDLRHEEPASRYLYLDNWIPGALWHAVIRESGRQKPRPSGPEEGELCQQASERSIHPHRVELAGPGGRAIILGRTIAADSSHTTTNVCLRC